MRVKVFTCWLRQPFCFCSGLLFGDGCCMFFGYDYLELYGANAQNAYRHIYKSYCSRPIRTKICYWAVFLERIESRMPESHESLVCLVCQVCQCRTLVHLLKKAKSEIWNQTAHTLCNLLNNTTTVRPKNKTLMVQLLVKQATKYRNGSDLWLDDNNSKS